MTPELGSVVEEALRLALGDTNRSLNRGPPPRVVLRPLVAGRPYGPQLVGSRTRLLARRSARRLSCTAATASRSPIGGETASAISAAATSVAIACTASRNPFLSGTRARSRGHAPPLRGQSWQMSAVFAAVIRTTSRGSTSTE